MKRTLHEVRQTDIIKIHGNLRRRSARYRHVVKVGVKGVMSPRFAISSLCYEQMLCICVTSWYFA